MRRLMQLLFPLSRFARHAGAALVLGLCWLASPQALLAQQPGLNDVTLPVADRSNEARATALREGLSQILVRLTGDASPGGLPGVAAMLEQPEAWVAQYGYAGQGDDLRLQARFDVRAVSEQLARSGAPVWGAGRPPLLVWATPDLGDIYARDSEAGFIRALRDRAGARGLPLLLPLMDGDDRNEISAADIRGRFDQSLRAASRRYDSPLSAAVVYYTSGRPNLRWRVVQDGNTLREGQLTADSEAQLAADLADTLSDYMAAQYAVQGNEARLARVQVVGVENLTDWQALRTFVAGQAGVRDVALARLVGDVAELRLDFAGDSSQLERLLVLHGRLSACNAPRMPGNPATTTVDADVSLTDGLVLRLCWSA